MMNIDERILMEAIESPTRRDLRELQHSQYPDDYFELADEPEEAPLRPASWRVSLKPDELALHQKLLEIAKANSPAPPEMFVG